MTKIKICGLTRPEDIRAANLAGSDYAGFVFAPSPRQVTPAAAAELIKGLRGGVRRVGVFVNLPPREILALLQKVPLDVIQLHGDEPDGDIRLLQRETPCEVWKAIRVKNGGVLRRLKGCPAHRVLLDSYCGEAYGGLGKSFRWDLLEGLDMSRHILAGGLGEANLISAVRQVRPYMVDLSSGVETNGKKDPFKINTVVALVRSESNV